jgi:hypothetical protein
MNLVCARYIQLAFPAAIIRVPNPGNNRYRRCIMKLKPKYPDHFWFRGHE